MRRREEKRRKFHEALLQTLYPRSSSSSPSSSPSPVENVDEEPFDVTLINPEDYVKVDSSNHGDDNETGEDSGSVEKQSRAQRKRLRKKMLKEEATRRGKMIGPLLPTEMIQTRDAGERNGEENSDHDEEEASCSQPVRLNVHEKEENTSGNGKTKKVKKRREAKKLAKETSNKDPT